MYRSTPTTPSIRQESSVRKLCMRCRISDEWYCCRSPWNANSGSNRTGSTLQETRKVSSTAGRRSFSSPSSTFPIGNRCSSFIEPASMCLNRGASPAILLQLVIESDPVDVEDLRGMTLIASTFLYHPQDVGPLHVLQLLARAARGRGAWWLEDEIRFVQFRLLPHNHGALHRILQFTNVPQPGLLLQQVHGRG